MYAIRSYYGRGDEYFSVSLVDEPGEQRMSGETFLNSGVAATLRSWKTAVSVL